MTLAALIKDSIERKEDWHYTSLVPYVGMELSLPTSNENVDLPPALTSCRMVFVDGLYKAGLSSVDAFSDLLTIEAGGYNYKIEVAGQSCLVIDPIEILYVNSDTTDASEVSADLNIVLGENSRLTVIERHIGAGSALQVRHHKMNITLAAQSKLVHAKVISGHTQSLHVAQTKVSVAAGAFYDHFGLIVGGKLVRSETNVDLNGPLAEARLVASMLLRDQSHGDITTQVRHKEPHGSSYQVCKTVLTDRAKGVFQGKVIVDQDAQKTDANQLWRSLLLSKQAEMNAKPELEIYADDVKCSHGTAVGDLDEDALFYLLSRGIDRKTARRMLVDAFIGELIDDIQSSEIATLMQGEVQQWLLM